MRSIRGFTILEWMLATTIGLFLLAGIFSLYVASRNNTYQLQTYNELQENGRLAMNLLLQDLRQTGFLGDYSGQGLRLNDDVSSMVKLMAGNDCLDERGEHGGTFPSSDADGVLRPFLARHTNHNGVLNADLSCLQHIKLQPDSDVLALKRVIGAPINSPNITLNPLRIYLAGNVNQALFFAGKDSDLLGLVTHLVGAKIWEFQHHVYYVQEVNGIPELRLIQLTDQMRATYSLPLVQGVEKIRVLLAVDDSIPADGITDRYLPPEKISPAIWNTFAITGIRLFLLVRAQERSLGYRNEQIYQLGDLSLPPFNDNYQRLLLQSSVQFRNSHAEITH
ncbi:PilW family protein [uncultured Tolumonas sp.]|uniref:PilW family protein n=1 Tax=uncultured Tolumonas sp. TaxID=263765 RepID=UPI002A0A2A00|nr:PilW family protein [uncultured Tolumonas sp.]